MRTHILVLTLACGPWLLAHGQGGAAEASAHPGVMNVSFADGSVRFLSGSVTLGLEAVPSRIKLWEHPRGLYARVEQPTGRAVTFSVAVRGFPGGGRSGGCLADWPEGWNQGRAEIVETMDGPELRVQHPREASCVLVGKVAEEGPPKVMAAATDRGQEPSAGAHLDDVLISDVVSFSVRSSVAPRARVVWVKARVKAHLPQAGRGGRLVLEVLDVHGAPWNGETAPSLQQAEREGRPVPAFWLLTKKAAGREGQPILLEDVRTRTSAGEQTAIVEVEYR